MAINFSLSPGSRCPRGRKEEREREEEEGERPAKESLPYFQFSACSKISGHGMKSQEEALREKSKMPEKVSHWKSRSKVSSALNIPPSVRACWAHTYPFRWTARSFFTQSPSSPPFPLDVPGTLELWLSQGMKSCQHKAWSSCSRRP